MTTEEKNKLIADFMQFNLVSAIVYSQSWFDELKYHSSWEWLMPVIKKCKESDNFKYSYDWTYIKNGLFTVDIEKTWLAVIAFIKWHNQQSKS